MRSVKASEIQKKVTEMVCHSAVTLPDDVKAAFREKLEYEEKPAAREIFRQLLENSQRAENSGVPLCQDCGLAIFFVEIGEEVQVEGSLKQAIEDGMIQGYAKALLRKSSCDPLTRENRGDNSPAIIHFDFVPGDSLKISFMAKGGGSENMSRVTMLTPAQGWPGIREYVLRRVAEAGPNPCPPIMLGIGIGGTFEKAPIMAKHALLRGLNDQHPDERLAALEKELLDDVNKLGIGPMGLGGKTTCLAVKIEMAPCHIASLPLAVNVQCHSIRHEEVTI
ncbi:fumarate hydratase [Desulfobaculum bizertense]|uniref:Fumarate hydratase subunit alpha n=1 Tax=Desulfobaculum bizertense DSM 18034 TaxID=1121442 RepID=A0A1T4WHP6_9BACT|nr:fumarate hydratase [Desulfobaculum bizertense]UIJ39354.1 fumarate hydratase [Desulfobaculum bizertense]SKA76699.1 fumarate hydratase subunit alpha [Desulfobaculum bizertense DSM 18034]